MIQSMYSSKYVGFDNLAERDPGHGVQTPSRKSYNPFDSDDEDTNGHIRSNVSYDIKSFEENAESLTFDLDTDDLSWEEAILAHAQVADHKIHSDADGEEVLYRKDTELFTDKTVTEDNAYNSIMGIVIDDGVPTNEKVWIKSEDNQETKIPPTFLDDLGLENEDSVNENQCGTDDSKKVNGDLSKRESDDSGAEITGNETKISHLVDDTRDSQLSERENLSKVEKKGIETSEEEHVVTLKLPEESSEKSSIASKVINDSNKNPTEEEATSSQSEELKETGDNSIGSVLSYNSKLESESIILDFNSDKSEEIIEAVVAKPPVCQMMSRLDDADSRIATPSVDHKVHNGDTSFSAPSSITYMGPHAHTGSVSIRSESSAGSTRSFAFPVLQAEWNSSPVRMTKAEQRHMQKQRGWFSSFVCC